MLRRILILALTIGAAGVLFALALPPTETTTDPRQLILKTFRGLATVPIRIGDSEALNFVIDSGSQHTTLNDAGLAKELNLHTRKAGWGRGMGGAKLPVMIAPDVAIRSSDGELFRTDLAVHHLSSMLEDEAGRNLHGLLGSDLFDRYVVDINPALGTVSLYEPTHFSYEGPGHIIPLIIQKRRPFVRARVITVTGKSAKVRLMVDTGSEYHLGLILGTHRNIRVPDQHLEVKALGVGGGVDAYIGPVSGLEIGSMVFGRTPAAFFQPNSMPASLSMKNFDGLIGNGLLGQYRTILDYHRKELILEAL